MLSSVNKCIDYTDHTFHHLTLVFRYPSFDFGIPLSIIWLWYSAIHHLTLVFCYPSFNFGILLSIIWLWYSAIHHLTLVFRFPAFDFGIPLSIIWLWYSAFHHLTLVFRYPSFDFGIPLSIIWLWYSAIHHLTLVLLTLPKHLSSPPVFSGVRVTRSIVLYVYFVDRCLFLWIISFGHCVVSPSIYRFWLPHMLSSISSSNGGNRARKGT